MLQTLLNELSRYTVGLSATRDLESWLISDLQAILDSGDQRAIDLANEVDCILIELGEGLITDEEVLARVEGLVRVAQTSTIVELIGAAPPIIEDLADTSAETITSEMLDRPVTDLALQGSFA